MDTNLKLEHVYQIDDFIVDGKAKMISVPQSWMEEYGEEHFPMNIQQLLKQGFKIQLNIL